MLCLSLRVVKQKGFRKNLVNPELLEALLGRESQLTFQ